MANPPPELQSTTDVLKCGYLRKQKTTHKRYFVLRAPDDSCAAGRLEYYESERKFRHKSAPKRAVSLDSCFNISKRADARNKFMVALYTKDEYLAVAAENEHEQDAWYRAITELHARGKALQQQCSDHHHHHHHHHPHQQLQQQSLYPHAESGGESGGSTHAGDDVYGAIAPSSAFKEVWQVNLKPRGLGQTRSMFGVYRLCLSSRKISFVKLNSEKPDVTLQLMNVRRCGHSESFFFIEVGRSAVTGPGEFWMQVEDCVVAQNMHETILEAMKAMSEFSEFRPRSKSHSASSSNPISVPPRRHLNSLPPSQTGLSRRSRTESANSTQGASSPAGGGGGGGSGNNNPAAAATTTITNIISHSSRHPLNGGVGGAASGHNFRARTSSEGERTILTSRPSSVTGSPVSVSPTPPRLQQQQLNQQGIRGCLVGRTTSRLQAAPIHSRYVTVPAPGASQPPSSAVSPVSCASSTSPSSSSGPSSGRGSSASDALLLLYVKVNSGDLGGGGAASASGSPSDGGFASSSDEYGSSPVDARRHQGLVHRSATPESLSRTPPPIREEQDDGGHNIHHHHHHVHQQQVNNYISMGKSCAQNGHHHHHNHHPQQQLHRGVLLARRASQDENASGAEGTSDLAGVAHRKRTYSSCTSPPPPPPPAAQSATGVQQQQQRKPLDDYALMNAGSLTSSGSGSSYTGSSYTSRSASPRPPAGPSTPQTSQAAHLQHSYPEDYGEIHVGSCQRPGAACKDDGYMPMSPGVAPVPTSSSSSSCSSAQSVVSSSTTATSSSMTLSAPGGVPSDDYVPMSPKSVSAPQEILNPRRRQEITDPSGYMVMSPGTNNGSCSPECSPYMKMWSSSKLSVCSADGKGGGDAGCEYMNMSPGLVAGTPPDYFFTPTSAEPPKVSCYYYSLPRSFKPGLRKSGDGVATAAGGSGARFSPGNLTERQLFGGDKSSSTSSDSLGHDPDQPVASGSSPTASGVGGGITKAEPRKVQQQQQGIVRPTRLSLGGLKSSTLPRTYECPAEPVSPGEYVNIEFGDVQTAQAVVDAQRRLSSATRLAVRANYSVVPDWSAVRTTTTTNAAAATAAAAAATSVVSPLAAARGNPAGASYGGARPVQNGNAGSDYMSTSNVGGLNYGGRVNQGVGVDYASLHMGRGCAPLEQETDGDYTEMRFGVTAPSAAPLSPPSNHSNLEGSKGLTSPTSRLNRLSLMDQMTAAYPMPNPDHGAKVIRADAQGRRRHSSETFSSTTTASAALGSGGASPAMPTSTSLLSPSFSCEANRLGSASFESVYLKDAAGDSADCGGASRESGFENGLNYVALELSSEECQRAAAAAAAATAASTAGLDGARANTKVSTGAVDSGAYASIDFARSDGACPAQES